MSAPSALFVSLENCYCFVVVFSQRVYYADSYSYILEGLYHSRNYPDRLRSGGKGDQTCQK